MRIGYVGSCFSGQIVDALLIQDENNKLIRGLAHLRTDVLVGYLAMKSGAFPDRESARAILSDLDQKGELNKNSNRITGQTEESLSAFVGKLREIDCLLIDNNYDLSSKLWRVALNGKEYTLSNLQIKKPITGYEDLGLFPVDGAHGNYQELVNLLLGINPNINIFFLQYPIDGFARVNGQKRIRRAESFTKEISGISGAFVVPYVNVPVDDLSDKGAHYFSGRTYQIYARLIMRVMQGDGLPQWFKPGTPLAYLENWLEGKPKLEEVTAAGPGQNVLILGSCLSGRVALELEKRGFSIAGYLYDMRLDMFARYLADCKTFGAPKSVLDGILERYSSDVTGKRYTRLKRRLRMQSWEYLEQFVEKLKAAQALVIDNNYDLGRPVSRVMPDKGDGYLLSNVNLQDIDVPHRNMGLMDPASAQAAYRSLFSHLRRLNPALRIVFLQYPVVASSTEENTVEERLVRARVMAKALDDVGCCVFPMVRLEKEYISEKNPNHFSDEVYATFAQAVKVVLGGKTLPFRATDEVKYMHVVQFANEGKTTEKNNSNNPYENLPARQYWKPAVADCYLLSIAGVYDKKFPIRREDRISTFGSCFAQHIGHRLKARGFNFLDMEPAPPSLGPAERTRHGYGIYSARYGNVYTSLQMLQLFQQSFGEICYDEVWESGGRYYDPFRPNIFPDGFSSPAEMLAERHAHLARVRTLFETSDIIVLTMGLTECWCNRETGAAYPTAPGVTVGQFDPALHEFRNLGYTEIHEHLQEFLARLGKVNPRAKMLLTVSPVPLTATYEDRHVLVSTMHSKSMLRAVAGEISTSRDDVDYFPSYEIIMSHPFRGMFFKSNLRTIHDEGVDFVMSHFFAQHNPAGETCGSSDDEEGGDFCDEVFLELSRKMVG